MVWAEARVGARDETDRARERLAGFRRELYRCFTARADALSELCDAALCKQDRVHMLAELSLEPGHQRGHGALYDALNCGKVQASRLRWALAGVPLPAWDDGRIRLAVDVSNWLRPDAATSPGRSFCHCYGRGKNSAQMIPGWPYSLVAALEPDARPAQEPASGHPPRRGQEHQQEADEEDHTETDRLNNKLRDTPVGDDLALSLPG